MNLNPTAHQNIAELLMKIIEFARARHRVLKNNIKLMTRPGYVPEDLPVQEFTDILNHAIIEHVENYRLVLCDTAGIKFGFRSSMHIIPLVDHCAARLLQQNPDDYLAYQLDRILENTLNQKLAQQMLYETHGYCPLLNRPISYQQWMHNDKSRILSDAPNKN